MYKAIKENINVAKIHAKKNNLKINSAFEIGCNIGLNLLALKKLYPNLDIFGLEINSKAYNFAKNKIPVIFYFNGVHEDYHKPSDTIEKIDFDKINTITRLIFLTAWEIANRDERIKLRDDL